MLELCHINLALKTTKEKQYCKKRPMELVVNDNAQVSEVLQMAGKKFLNPISKIVICLAGILILGYFVHTPLYKAIFDNGPWDNMLVGRLVVMIAFVYLLAQSLRELSKRDST